MHRMRQKYHATLHTVLTEHSKAESSRRDVNKTADIQDQDQDKNMNIIYIGLIDIHTVSTK